MIPRGCGCAYRPIRSVTKRYNPSRKRDSSGCPVSWGRRRCRGWPGRRSRGPSGPRSGTATPARHRRRRLARSRPRHPIRRVGSWEKYCRPRGKSFAEFRGIGRDPYEPDASATDRTTPGEFPIAGVGNRSVAHSPFRLVSRAAIPFSGKSAWHSEIDALPCGHFPCGKGSAGSGHRGFSPSESFRDGPAIPGGCAGRAPGNRHGHEHLRREYPVDHHQRRTR